uniref:BED-type domain-containing protein n=1 Tax=Nymphaea colorata TaxID=210225 RepID=A0A5K1EBN6_9MAGN
MSDPAWQWCTRVNPKDRLRVKCNYCKQIISGGISRFKNHIAGTHSDVAACNGSQEIIEEGEAGEQWNVGDIPLPTEGIEALNEENEDDDGNDD